MLYGQWFVTQETFTLCTACEAYLGNDLYFLIFNFSLSLSFLFYSHRRLSHNPLRSMNGNLSGLFPSLSVLYVTGIGHWVLEKAFFQLPMLKHVSKLLLSFREVYTPCQRCSLNRRNFSWSPRGHYVRRRGCHLYINSVNNLSVVVQTLNGTYFHVECKNNIKNNINKLCKHRLHFYSYSVGNTCWQTTLTAVNCQSFVGSLAALLNLVVFLNIVTSRTLRKNVSMLFVCNMALSDLLLGIYIMHIGIYLNSLSFMDIHNKSLENCLKIGFLWMLGQAGSIITSFWLTIERYLVIVFSLKPNVRITRRMAMILISVCWLVAVFLTGFALHYNYFSNTFLCVPLRLDYNIDIRHPFTFTLTIGSVAILLYMCSFLLYIHIFVTAKRAAQSAGVKRESKLAKRISVLVGSNVIFFIVPVLFLGITVISGSDLSVREVLGSMMDIIPSFCLSVNSFLNPVIHAFRTEHFKNVLKERLSVIRGRFRSVLPW